MESRVSPLLRPYLSLFLLLPEQRDQGYEFYRQMVKEVNTTQVDPEEILSFNLYRYDRQKEEIEEVAV